MPPIMKGASILSWKGLTSWIHPPLPLSSRDSQRLLSLLNTSFTDALDKKHPKVTPAGANTTDEHLHSILSSPIFATPAGSTPLPDQTSRASGSTADPVQLSISHGVERNVKTFKKMIFNGTATLPNASIFLWRVLGSAKEMTSGEALASANSIKHHGVGSLVLNWLWSSGLEDTEEMLSESYFLNALFPFIIAEGFHQQAWHIFRQLGHQASAHPLVTGASTTMPRKIVKKVRVSEAQLSDHLRSLHRLSPSPATSFYQSYARIFRPFSLWLGHSYRLSQQNLLHKFVLHALGTSSTTRLNDAMRIFLKAFKSSMSTAEDFPQRALVLERAGILIVAHIERLANAKANVDAELYQTFQDSVNHWYHAAFMIYSGLSLYHPFHPTPWHAYRYIDTLTPASVSRMDVDQRRRVLRMGFDVAEILLADASARSGIQAKRLMDTLGKHFNAELGHLERLSTIDLEDQIEKVSSSTDGFNAQIRRVISSSDRTGDWIRRVSTNSRIGKKMEFEYILAT